jgi:adenosine deaminase
MQVAKPVAGWDMARLIVDLVVSFVMPQGPAIKTIPLELIEKLPKTDLHVHLDGSLRLATILELGERHKIDLPARDEEGLRAAMHLGQNCGTLVEYLKAFDVTLRVMQTEESLRRIAYELAEDAARENVRYMEVRYAPMLHTRRGLKLTTVVESVLEGLREAQDKLGIESNVIICGIRNVSPESSLEMAELAVAYKGRGVVGFDLAGAEYDHPAKHHKQSFQLVRDNNINVTIHAGEAYGPESIFQAITKCYANRIGHGTWLFAHDMIQNPAIPDPKKYVHHLAEYVASQRITMEVCLTSNAQTLPRMRNLAHHPLRQMLDHELSVSICTDNRLMSNTSVTHELRLAIDKIKMTPRELRNVVIAGFKGSFFPGTYSEKRDFVRQVIDRYETLSATLPK